MRYDVIIVGGGVAGMTAALYVRRAGRQALIFEAGAFGGQILPSDEVENYPGLPHVTGAALAQALEEQIRALGAEQKQTRVTGIVREADGFRLLTDSGGEYRASKVILAVGVRHRRLEIPGEARLTGRGVSWCATCDGNFFRGRTVAVAGGGNTAVQEALHLSSLCQTVYLIHRRDTLRAEARLVERMRERANIVFLPSRVIREIVGETRVEGVILEPAGGTGDCAGRATHGSAGAADGHRAERNNGSAMASGSAELPARSADPDAAGGTDAEATPAAGQGSSHGALPGVGCGTGHETGSQPETPPARGTDGAAVPGVSGGIPPAVRHMGSAEPAEASAPNAAEASGHAGAIPDRISGRAQAHRSRPSDAPDAADGGAPGEQTLLRVSALFEAVGMIPQNQPFAELIPLDPAGYFPAGEDCRTSVPGVFAAGDCRAKSLRQLVGATADGAMAAVRAVEELEQEETPSR